MLQAVTYSNKQHVDITQWGERADISLSHINQVNLKCFVSSLFNIYYLTELQAVHPTIERIKTNSLDPEAGNPAKKWCNLLSSILHSEWLEILHVGAVNLMALNILSVVTWESSGSPLEELACILMWHLR